MLRGIFSTKSLDAILEAASGDGTSLKRSLGPLSVTLLGIGAIIGTGIYTAIGTATAGESDVRPGAGPSLVLSFLITAAACAFTALCYAELAAMVPASGSAYTYAYATLGELVAWIIGWDLIIEYGISNTATAISWSGYFRALLGDLGVHIPAWLASDFRTAGKLLETNPAAYAHDFGSAPTILGHPLILNLPALAITLAITALLVWGIKESARINSAMVLFKILVLVFFVAAAIYLVGPSTMAHNWHPFQPNGWRGTLSGAAIVFYAFIGFDAVSTVAEETRDPGRSLPIGILASLAICAIFYAAIAAVFTGMVPYPEFVEFSKADRAEPLTAALRHVAGDSQGFRGSLAYASRVIVGAGSVVAQTAVLLVFLMGQPRIFFSMARDGLLPPAFAKLHPRFKTPYIPTILTGTVVGLIASVANVDEIVDLTNIGTLFAFVLVSASIPILRLRDPSRHRPFRVPFGPFVLPMLGMASCLGLMMFLPPESWWRFAGWLMLGLAVYSSYGYARSDVGQQAGRPDRTPQPLKLAAVGFLLAALGLFAVPHGHGLVALARSVADPQAVAHTRAVVGVLTFVLGAVTGLVGWSFAARREPS